MSKLTKNTINLDLYGILLSQIQGLVEYKNNNKKIK